MVHWGCKMYTIVSHRYVYYLIMEFYKTSPLVFCGTLEVNQRYTGGTLVVNTVYTGGTLEVRYTGGTLEVHWTCKMYTIASHIGVNC